MTAVKHTPRLERYIDHSLTLFLVFLVALINSAHFRILMAMHTGLDFELVREGFVSSNASGIMDYLQLPEIALWVFSMLCVAIMLCQRKRISPLIRRTGIALTIGSALLIVPEFVSRVTRHHPRSVALPLQLTPALFLGGDAVSHWLAGPDPHTTRAQQLAPLEVRGMNPSVAIPQLRKQNRAELDASGLPASWNVVVIVMESTGRDYVFDTSAGNDLPMPTLHALAQESRDLRNHYASSNSSARSLFSIFSGFYPRPTANLFCTRPNIVFPGLGSYLGSHYDRFLVTPGRLQSYFPHGFLRANGFSELWGCHNLSVDHFRPYKGGGRNELDATDVFLDRMGAAKEPFLGVYYSYAPHYHYYDHGPEYRIFDDLEVPKNRYYNGLRLLDTQIDRILQQLKNSGRMERTVFMIVGDHGEAFGQHAENWTHSRASYSENYAVPTIIYQPRLFPPRKVSEFTSHVDLLPTLLDGLGLSFDSSDHQGWPLGRGAPQRDYIYMWGNEQALLSLGADGTKLEIRFEDGYSRYFNLKTDPNEKEPHGCTDAQQSQLDNLLRYWRFQSTDLEAYNDRLLELAGPNGRIIDARSYAKAGLGNCEGPPAPPLAPVPLHLRWQNAENITRKRS